MKGLPIPGLGRGRRITPEALEEAERDRGNGLGRDPGASVTLHAAIEWLCRAQDRSTTQDGGVARHFGLIDGWSASYPETTGYIIPTFIECGRRFSRPDLIDRARRMTDWLVSIQLENGAFQGGMIDQTPVVPVGFNTGQILMGLAAAVKEFGDVYRRPMERAGDWLVAMQEPDGSWLRTASPFADAGAKTYYTHVAWGLIEAERISPGRGYAEAALRHNRWTLTQQHDNGWFERCFLNNPTFPVTHTIGYAIRGVLEAHRFFGHEELLDGAIRAADGVLSAMDENGFIPGRLNAEWESHLDWACLTGTVQNASCWFRLYEITRDEKYLNAGRLANKFVRRTISLSGPEDRRGGVKGSFPVDGDYGRYTYLNWAAKFFIDSQLAELDAMDVISALDSHEEHGLMSTPVAVDEIISTVPAPRALERELSPQPARVSASDALDNSLIRGVAWTAGAKWLSQLLSWPATIIVARLLTPDDFGLVAMATVYIGLVNLVNEFGLGVAVIRQRTLTTRSISQISGLCALFGFGGFLFTLAAAIPLARFYNAPSLSWVVFALSLNFIITSFKTVPLALMQRDLQFKEAATNEAIGAIIQSIVLVVLARLGFSYWSLVIASLVTSVSTTILIYYQRPHPIALPRMNEIRDSLVFGSHLVGSRIAWYLYTNADFFVIGRVLGKSALGNYSIGWDFATIPVEKVTTLIGRVAPPIFSAVQDDKTALRRYLGRLTSGIALLTVPAGLGLALVAEDFVQVILGDEWRGAIAPLQLLAVYACFRSIIPLVSQVGNTVGLSRFVMRNSVMSALVLPVAFIIGSHWGTVGVAAAWIFAYPIVSVPLCIKVCRAIGMTAGDYMRALWPALSSGAVMTPIVLLTQRLMDGSSSPILGLLMQVTVGAAAYVASMYFLHRGELRLIASTVRGAV